MLSRAPMLSLCEQHRVAWGSQTCRLTAYDSPSPLPGWLHESRCKVRIRSRASVSSTEEAMCFGWRVFYSGGCTCLSPALMRGAHTRTGEL